jgi:transcription termination factor Rho
MNHGSQAEDKMIDETQETPAYDDERDYAPPREADEHFEEVDEADDDDFDDEEFEEEGEDNGGGEAQPKPKTVKVFDTEKKLKTLQQITHEPNDSQKRRRRRVKIDKIRSHGVKRKRRRNDEGGGGIALDFSTDFDNRSEIEEYTGYIQIQENGYGFMRSERLNFVAQELDIFISREMVNRYALRSGNLIQAIVRMKRNRKQRMVTHLLAVNEEPIETYRPATLFTSLTSVNPHENFRLTGNGEVDKSLMLMELLTPIGKGQRGLIVAPPRTGKTVLIEKIANGIAANHPEAEVMLLLIDERPEEVTHLTRRVKGKVYASCLDKPIEEHIGLASMVIDIAMRKVERGKDVIILLDSITRMARAYNNQQKNSGRTLSGGVDAKALQEPKKFFGAARKIEEGGSLTIIATALVQTGSQMDEVIFQEFKGTGNMELVLNRRLAEKRIFPAIDIGMSGTRREELILPPEFFKAASKFRRYLSNMTEANQMPAALQALEKFRTTKEFAESFA